MSLFNKLLKRDKKFDSALNKTLKHSDRQKCTKFCKQDYMPNVNKTYDKMFGTIKNSKNLNQSMFFPVKRITVIQHVMDILNHRIDPINNLEKIYTIVFIKNILKNRLVR
jgi:hypothetical protein